jgi:zinc protease
MQAVQTGNHLRSRPRTEEMIDKVDLDHAVALYKASFADLGGFTFVFVGNLDLAKLQPLVETYLGSLPSAKTHAKWRDVGVKYPVGKVTKTVTRGSEPKSFVNIVMSAPDKWTQDLSRDAQILTMVARIVLREVLREDMGGVYGVQIGANVSRRPTQRRELDIFFGCDPANVEKLRAAAVAELGKLATKGTDDEHLAKVAEQLRRQRETDLKTNRWWVSNIERAVDFGEDFTKSTDIEATIKRVTNANVKAAAKHFFDEKNVIFAVMTPVPAKP